MKSTKEQKWILIAGTGTYNLPESVNLASAAIGKAMAREGYGLVVGGWQGVDYVVSEAFSKELNQQRKPLRDYLIQVVANGKEPVFRGGEIVYVESGLKEWTESTRYADAVVLIGGLGGTYETYTIATQEQKPVFPVASTEGDARQAYNDILNNWPIRPVEGISRETFEKVLSHPVGHESDAQSLANDLMELINEALRYQQEPRQIDRQLIFISYSHKDRRWLEKLRLMLKPLETYRQIHIWDDTAIESGQEWLREIQNAIGKTAVAVFLVSANFLASPFIGKEELERFLALARENETTILWIPVSAGRYDLAGLDQYQAAHDPAKPLDTMSPAKQNIVMVNISKKIEAAVDKRRQV